VTNRQLPMRLARLVVAAAWADGRVSEPERTFLRRRFEAMPGISGADWAELSALLEEPMTPEAQQHAVEEVLEVVRSKQEKGVVLDTLLAMVAADSSVTQEETDLVEQVRSALEKKPTNVLRRVSRLVGTLLRKSLAGAG
jgi:uncharacterized tellurite resistance protein B-like protein